jgi:hypothetical protein
MDHYFTQNEQKICVDCNYITTRTANMVRHLKSLKHKIRTEKNCVKLRNFTQNEHKITQNEHNDNNSEKMFACNICKTDKMRKYNYERHIMSKNHRLNQMKQSTNITHTNHDKHNITTTKNNVIKETSRRMNITSNKYMICECCKFKTTRKYDYDRHIKSKRHIQMMNTVHNNETTQYICNVCSKQYKTRSGLYKHQKQCSIKNALIEPVNQTDLKNAVLEIAKSNEAIMELIKEPRIQVNSNITNNTMNIENYLNIECKDAINMTDFVKQIQITLNDLLYLGNNGFSNSIQQLLFSSLKDMEQTKRPIHCTNKKKKIIYIKDENIWEKDEEHHKIKKTIDYLHKKEINSALGVMDNQAELFEEDNIIQKNNIIISLTNYNKDDTLKSVIKHITKNCYLEKQK